MRAFRRRAFKRHALKDPACRLDTQYQANVNKRTLRQSGDILSYIDIEGATTFYQMSGHGPPLVFIHGWSFDHSSWHAQVEFFSNTYRTIAYDWRGMGRSSGGQAPYRFSQLVDDLTGLLAALAVTRPLICAHSLGGDLALQYAICNPGNVRALIVADAPGPRNIFTSNLMYTLLQAGTAVAELFFRNSFQPFVPFFQYLFFGKDFASAHPNAIRAWQPQFLSNSRVALLNAGFAQAQRENPLPKLQQILAPTLIVRGAGDRLVPQREVDAYLAIPGARCYRIKEAGHSVMIEQPSEFNQVMAGFLRGVR